MRALWLSENQQGTKAAEKVINLPIINKAELIEHTFIITLWYTKRELHKMILLHYF